jgi:hypothetical protein
MADMNINYLLTFFYYSNFMLDCVLIVTMCLLKNAVRIFVLIFLGFSNDCCGAMLRGVNPLEFPEPAVIPFAIIPGLQPTPGHRGIVTINDNVAVGLGVNVLAPRHTQSGNQFTLITVPTTIFNIFFPVDGKQPTTRQAAIWSCANVGAGNTNHPVTDWYVAMFGGTNAALTMGFDVGVNTCPIITLDQTTMMANGLPSPGLFLDRATAFWDTFRRIAANPVGRVLLYRLLIEIRRTQANNGVQEIPLLLDDSINARNEARRVVIKYKENAGNNRTGGIFAWEYTSNGGLPEIFCNFEPARPGVDLDLVATCVASANGETPWLPCKYYTSEYNRYDYAVSLFHEMLHWYQYLRDYNRSVAEFSYAIENIIPGTLASYLGYNRCSDFRSWWGAAASVGIRVDELRVMCGGGNEGIGANQNWHNGDDLSENVFLVSISPANLRYLCFGHSVPIPRCNRDVICGTIRRVLHNVYTNTTTCLQAIIPNWNNASWRFVAGDALLRYNQ